MKTQILCVLTGGGSWNFWELQRAVVGDWKRYADYDDFTEVAGLYYKAIGELHEEGLIRTSETGQRDEDGDEIIMVQRVKRRRMTTDA